MKCCGKERNTKFCPDCGNNLGPSLRTLLSFCERHYKQSVKQLDRLRDRQPDSWEGSRTHLKWLKWKRWSEDLKTLLETNDVR